jgi:hypothetical protein
VTGANGQPGPRSLSVEALLFVGAAVAFVALRAATALTAPVGGLELDHLSGAWQASIGVSDDRYLPTLAQALAALTFLFTTSELPARVLMVALGMAVPAALWALRPYLGSGAALGALFLLAVDPVTVFFGGTANAFALDLVAIAGVALVWSHRGLRRRRLAWGAVGLAAVLSGALVLPFVAAAVAVAPRRRLTRDAFRNWFVGPGYALVVGAFAGILLASLAFAGGWDGLRVPLIQAFGSSFSGDPAAATTRDLIVLYEAPLLLAAVAAAAWLLATRRPAGLAHVERLLVVWFAFGLAWLLVSLETPGPASAGGAAVPAALLVAMALPAAVRAAVGADWRLPRVAVPVAVLLGALALFPALQWADRGRLGDGAEVARVTLLGIAAAGVLAALAVHRRTAPALTVVAALVGLPLLLAGAGGVAFGKSAEPLVSPYSPAQARELRDFAVAVRQRDGGPIAVHSSLRDQFTWAFRDSGEIIVSAEALATASVVIWPYQREAPVGFVPVDGEWAFTRSLPSPARDGLTLLQWLSDRSTLAFRVDRLAVYTRSGQ